MPVVITNTVVAKARQDAKPGGKPYELTDAKSQGLELRVRPRGAVWSLRYKVDGKSKRLTLAALDLLNVTEARELAGLAQATLRAGGAIDDGWATAQLVRLGKITAPAPAEPTGWTFAEAREKFLAMVKAVKSEATYADYRSFLVGKDLACIDHRPVGGISRQEMARLIADVHASGRQPTAERIASVIRPMWTWLGDDAQIADSGVEPGCMAGLKAPARSRVDDDDDGDDGAYVPPLFEIGVAIAAARLLVSPSIEAAIELTARTAQRRRAIVGARIKDFVPLDDGSHGVWRVPPASLKVRLRNGKRRAPLSIPLPPSAWQVVVRAAEARGETDSPYLFPAEGESGHMHVSTLTHELGYLPGVTATPHGLRRAFATHGEALLGMLRQDTKSVLDHGDVSLREVTHRTATGTGDVTGQHYALHDGTHRTRSIMQIWNDAVDAQVALAEQCEGMRDIEELRRLHARAHELRKSERAHDKLLWMWSGHEDQRQAAE